MANIDTQTGTDPVVSGPSPRQLELLLSQADEYGSILHSAFGDLVKGFDDLKRDDYNTVLREVDGYEITFEFYFNGDFESTSTWPSREVLEVKNPDGVEFRIDLDGDLRISGNGFHVCLAEEGKWVDEFERGTKDQKLACLYLLEKVADLLDKLKPAADQPEQKGVQETREGIVDLLTHWGDARDEKDSDVSSLDTASPEVGKYFAKDAELLEKIEAKKVEIAGVPLEELIDFGAMPRDSRGKPMLLPQFPDELSDIMIALAEAIVEHSPILLDTLRNKRKDGGALPDLFLLDQSDIGMFAHFLPVDLHEIAQASDEEMSIFRAFTRLMFGRSKIYDLLMNFNRVRDSLK